MEVPPIVLDRDGAAPLAVQIAGALRAAAATGTLRQGERLPSTRALAAVLGVSRTVTSSAYEQLHAEGWVSGRAGSGTYVTAAPPAGSAGRSTAASTPHGGAARRSCDRGPRAATTGGDPGCGDRRDGDGDGVDGNWVDGDGVDGNWVDGDGVDGNWVDENWGGVDLRAGSPCVEVIDRAAWRRAWRAAAEPLADARPRPAGVPTFRAAVVEHLLRHRGLPADPAAVLATSGSTAAVGELARTLAPGALVAMEEPGYRRAAAALAAGGARVVPVPVDAGGLVVGALPPGLAAVYCTPAHQYPLGARMAANRRVALVERARAEGFLVIEDDYDGDLRYDVAPLPLLAALGPDVVAHLGTTSKLLTPTLGAGWLVAPPDVRAAVLERRSRTGARPAPAGQRVFTALAAHGDLARHLRRLRRELVTRRALVVTAVGAAGLVVSGDEAGAHVVVALPDTAVERAVIGAAAARGVALDGLARHHAGTPDRFGLVLGYAGRSRSELAVGLAVVREVLADVCQAHNADSGNAVIPGPNDSGVCPR